MFQTGKKRRPDLRRRESWESSFSSKAGKGPVPRPNPTGQTAPRSSSSRGSATNGTPRRTRLQSPRHHPPAASANVGSKRAARLLSIGLLLLVAACARPTGDFGRAEQNDRYDEIMQKI